MDNNKREIDWNDWIDLSSQFQSTFQKGAEMTNISIVNDKEERPLKMISLNLRGLSPEDKTRFLKSFKEEARKNLQGVFGENSIKKNMVKEIEHMVSKNNKIDTEDLSAIATVYHTRGNIDYGKDIYRDFSENLYDSDKHMRSSAESPYGCMEKALKKVGKDIFNIAI